MHASIFLAESATLHEDGTFSLLRAGLYDFAGPPGKPIPFSGALVVRLVRDKNEQAKAFALGIECRDENDNRALSLSANVHLSRSYGSAAHLVLNLSGAFDRPGEYVFVLTVDGEPNVSWAVTARYIDAAETEEKGSAQADPQ